MSLPKLDKNWSHFSCVLTKETHGIIKSLASSQRLSMSEALDMIVKHYVQSGKNMPTKE